MSVTARQKKNIGKWSRIGGLALLVAGVAFADVEGNDLFKQAASLSPQESQKQSADYLSKMQLTQQKVTTLQDVARKRKDLIKLNCVNDKLTQLRGHIAVAQQSNDSLVQAVQKGDDETRRHEYTRMSILYQKSVVLGTEAENCVGEDASYVGATRVDVDIDPSVPQDDPTDHVIDVPIPQRPPAASPWA